MEQEAKEVINQGINLRIEVMRKKMEEEFYAMNSNNSIFEDKEFESIKPFIYFFTIVLSTLYFFGLILNVLSILSILSA